MPNLSFFLSRRTALAAFFGGATIAVAIAKSGPAVRRGPTTSFTTAFNSASSLPLADDRLWSTLIGSQLQVSDGPLLRVTRVEPFAEYGAGNASIAARSALIRRRAFAVHFETAAGAILAGNRVHKLTHKKHGTFDLFLVTHRTAPFQAHAMFN